MSSVAAQPYGQNHPVSISVSQDLKRSRLTVFFRGLLSFPHLIWMALWGVAAALTKTLTWIIGTFTGRLPEGLHNFLAGYVRYSTFVTAYRMYVTEPFPPFSGSAGAYAPIDVVLPVAEPQSRLTIFFRPILAIPAVLMVLLWGIWALLVSIAAFFYCMIFGRISPGLENQLANYLRYNVQATAYRFRLTAEYPRVSKD
jgi:hypothetical protein